MSIRLRDASCGCPPCGGGVAACTSPLSDPEVPPLAVWNGLGSHAITLPPGYEPWNDAWIRVDGLPSNRRVRLVIEVANYQSYRHLDVYTVVGSAMGLVGGVDAQGYGCARVDVCSGGCLSLVLRSFLPDDPISITITDRGASCTPGEDGGDAGPCIDVSCSDCPLGTQIITTPLVAQVLGGWTLDAGGNPAVGYVPCACRLASGIDYGRWRFVNIHESGVVEGELNAGCEDSLNVFDEFTLVNEHGSPLFFPGFGTGRVQYTYTSVGGRLRVAWDLLIQGLADHSTFRTTSESRPPAYLGCPCASIGAPQGDAGIRIDLFWARLPCNGPSIITCPCPPLSCIQYEPGAALQITQRVERCRT